MKINEVIDVSVTEVDRHYAVVEHEGRKFELGKHQVSWRNMDVDIREILSLGDKVRVKVTRIGDGRPTLLSLRDLLPGGSPWEGAFEVGDEFYAPMVLRTPYGYFFELTQFCLALLRNESASRNYQLGDRINLEIVKADLEHHRVEVVEI